MQFQTWSRARRFVLLEGTQLGDFDPLFQTLTRELRVPFVFCTVLQIWVKSHFPSARVVATVSPVFFNTSPFFCRRLSMSGNGDQSEWSTNSSYRSWNNRVAGRARADTDAQVKSLELARTTLEETGQKDATIAVRKPSY